MQHSVSAALEADPAGLSSAAAKEAMAAEAEAVPVAAHTEAAAVAAVDVAAEQTEAADLSEESIQIPPAVAKADDAVAQRQATKGRRDGADGEVEVAKEASEADTVADGGASEAGIHALVTLETPPPLLPAGTPQSTTIAFSGDDAAAEENERVQAEADSSRRAAEQETAELKKSKKKPVKVPTPHQPSVPVQVPTLHQPSVPVQVPTLHPFCLLAPTRSPCGVCSLFSSPTLSSPMYNV